MPLNLRRRTLLSFVLVVFALVFAGTGCLGSVTEYKAGDKPVDAIIADVNGDGRPDIVIANGASSTLTVRLQGEHGFFDEAYTMKLPAGAAPSAITVGRFRKDGKPTVVVANRGGDSISVFDRFASGATPTKTMPLGAGSAPAALAVGDVDGDGDADLLVTTRQPTFPGCQTRGCVLVFRDKGSGLAYSYAAYPVGTDEHADYNPVSLAVGELWGGGRPEIAVVNRGMNETVVIDTIRDGFEKAGSYTSVDVKSPTTVGIGQLSKIQALSVGSSSGDGRIFAATGRGAFRTFARAPKPAALAAGDIVSFDPEKGSATSLAGVGSGQSYTSPLLKGATRLVPGLLDNGKDVDAVILRAGSDSAVVFTTSQQWSSPQALDLGKVSVGSTVQRVVKAKARTVDDWIYTPTLTGPDASSFRVEGCGRINKPGGDCTFTVTFAPTSSGVKQATIEIRGKSAYRTDNTSEIAWGRPKIALTGAATGATPPPAAATPLVTGVADDYGRYADDAGAAFFTTLRSLGMGENRMAVVWQPGQQAPTAAETGFLDRSIAEAQRRGIRVLLSIYPAVASQHDPVQFCAFARGVAQRYPYVKEIIVGNEPNKADFWSPVDPAAYTQLLARCYDELRPLGVRVVGGALSARKVGSGASPLEFLAGMGVAYRSLARSAPIMDLLSFHPYPNPDRIARGADAGYEWPNAGLPDLDRVKQAVEDAFTGTAQPTFSSTLRMVIDEIGWQAKIPAQYASFYSGVENSATVDEAQQAQFYAAAIARVACDPLVAKLLLFHLVDERGLNASATSGGWQSGLLRADLSSRSAVDAVRTAIAAGCASAKRTWTAADSVVGGSITLTASQQQVRIAGKVQRGVKFALGASSTEGVAWNLTIKNAAGNVVVSKRGSRSAPFDTKTFIAPVLLGTGSYTARMTLTATFSGKRSLSATKSAAS